MAQLPELLDSLPEEEKAVFLARIHSGPLPSPEAFEKYNKILPGAANRILKMAEREQDMRDKSISGALKIARARVWLSAGVSALFILAGTYCVIKGQPWPGAVIGLAGVAIEFVRRLPSLLNRD